MRRSPPKKPSFLKRVWAGIISGAQSTPPDKRRPREASRPTAEARPEITPTIDQRTHSTNTGADDSSQAVSVPKAETKSSTKESDKLSYKLWNGAYDELSKTESKLVDSYLEVLAKALAKDIIEAQHEENQDAAVGYSSERKHSKDLTAQVLIELGVPKAKTSVGDNPVERSSAKLDQLATIVLAKLKDPTKRQMFLEMLVRRGQSGVKRTEDISKAAGYIADKISSLKPAMDVILRIPRAAPAALPWAGICLGMKILSHPAESAQEQRDGFSFVASRMEWYYAMTSDLLDHKNKPNSGQDAASKLEKKLCNLYQAILRYQLRSVCYYYSNPFRQWYGNVDWKDSKKTVEDAERIFLTDWDYYKKVEASNLWRDMREKAESTNASLQDISHTLKGYFSQQNARAVELENHKYLQALWVVDPETEMDYLAEKRGGLYNEMCEWVLSHPKYTAFTAWDDNTPDTHFTTCDDNTSDRHSRLLWMQGPGGTGKTMVMISIVRNLLEQRKVLWPNLAYFFCRSAKNNQNTAAAIVRSLLWMLLIQQPDLIKHIHAKFQWAGEGKFDSESAITGLSKVFENIAKDSAPVYFLVDALDECEDGQELVIRLISTSLEVSNKVRWLVTSRTEVDLLRKVAGAITKGSVALDDIDVRSETGRDAMTIQHQFGSVALDEIEVLSQSGRDMMYIQRKLAALKEIWKLRYNDNLCELVTEEMHKRADGNLLWLAVVFDSVKTMRAEYALKEIQNAPRGVKELYAHKIAQIRGMETERCKRCYDVMRVVSLVYSLPILLSELEILVPWSAEFDPLVSLDECSAFLTTRRIKGSDEIIIDVNHKTAKDYIVDYGDTLEGGAVGGHADIVRCSINALCSEELDFFKLGRWKGKILKPLQLGTLLPIRYSLCFWLDHLCEAIGNTALASETLASETLASKALASERKALCETAFGLLKEHFLHLLESLGHLDQIEAIVSSFGKLLHVLKSSSETYSDVESDFVDFLRHAEKFTVIYMPIIRRKPLDTYGTALTFCPTQCKIKELFWGRQQAPLLKSVKGIKNDWDCSLIQELHGDTESITGAAYSCDGRLASFSSYEGSVRLWDLTTGREENIFCRGPSGICDITFTQDGKQLVAVWSDGEVKLWNLATGEEAEIHTGHSDRVHAIASSPDGTFASASADKTVRIWDPAIPDKMKVLTGHTSSVQGITFSPDGKQLASLSFDETIRLWDPIAASELRSISVSIGANEYLSALAFMPDGKSLLACPDGRRIMRWDLVSGAEAQPVTPDGGNFRFQITKFTLSRDGSQLAYIEYSGNEIHMWDLEKGNIRHGLRKGQSVTYSPDGKTLASVYGKGIRLWDSNMTTTVATPLQGHSKGVLTLAFSPNGEHLVSTSSDSVRIQNPVTGTEIVTPLQEGHSDYVRLLTFSPNGDQLATVSTDLIIKLRDTTAGFELQRTLEGHDDDIKAIAYSADGKQLVSGSKLGIVKLWDLATGLECLTFRCPLLCQQIALSPSGKQIAVQAYFNALALWDLDKRLDSPTWVEWIPCQAIVFSPDGTHLVCTSRKAVHFLDPATGAVTGAELQLPIDGHIPQLLRFSADGRILYTNQACINIGALPLEKALSDSATLKKAICVYRGSISCGEYDFLRLPPDEQARCVAFHGRFVAIGHDSGSVTIIELETPL